MFRTALTLGAVAAFVAIGSSAANAQVQLQCEALGARDISMAADYVERRNGRRKFSTEFEAAPGAGFNPGQRMVVLVEGRNVGSVPLRRVAGGDVQGDLNFDTNPDGGERPFPQNFPHVGQNSRVLVRIAGENVLGCRLR